MRRRPPCFAAAGRAPTISSRSGLSRSWRARRRGTVEYETDRARFLGRGRSAGDPAAMDGGAALSGTVGPVLDPVFSLRQRIRVQPGASAVLAFTTAAPEDRDQALALAARFGSLETVDRVFEESTASDAARRAELGLTPADAALFQRLAAPILFASPSLRSRESVARNRLGQPGLWPHAISGDVPIALVRIGADRNLEVAREVLQAHAYWRRCGLVADLVFLHDDGAGDELRRRLEDLVQNGPTAELVDRPGGVFLRDASRMSADDATLLEAAARLILRGGDGPLAAQLGRALADAPPLPPPLLPPGGPEAAVAGGSPGGGSALLFDNGLGGFTADGREYVITLRAGERPPAPWSNVLANPDFGCLVTEAGGGYTWAGNSQMNRLTPWSNDPVSDPPSEVVYLRDEETGEFWSPTPAPCGGEATTVVRHGQGYSLFTRTSHGLEQDLLVLISPTDQVKMVRLRVRNTGSRPRRLSATFYAEWVLGGLRDQASLQVVCSADAETGALFATNAWAGDFAGEVAFAAVAAIRTDTPPRSFTTDRAEFLGREGSPAAPAALGRSRLSGRAGELVDPCAALMTPLEVPPGVEEEIVFLLGQAKAPDEARRLVRAYAAPGRVQAALEEARALWDRILGTVQVRTPDPAMDLMLNRWLVYQALACRMWGRSAFYQSGGAFGFRDQLQDAMAIVYGAPEEARAQILRAAARQFEEGDVQHWWHPPAGRGVRTRITDDLVFLPLVVAHYVGVTGDASLLDERVPFLHAPVLRPGQEEDYGLPEVSPEGGSVYEHCERALECGLKLGPHGLPLMGTGDWNDGMNKVGAEGKGESVWNGWFMFATLREFAGLAERRGDDARAAWCRERADSAARGPGGTRMGRALVPARLLRRWNSARLGDQRRVPDRLDRPVVGGDFRRRRSRARPPGDGGGRGAPGAGRGRADPALHAPVRPRAPRTGLHQGLCAGDSRERRPIHARRHVGGAGDGAAGPGPAGSGAVRPAQPGPPRRLSRRGGTVQGGAVRGLRGCLRRAAAHRPRRLDLVHWFRLLAVPGRPGSDPWFPSAGHPAGARSLRPARLVRLRDHLPPPLGHLPRRCRELRGLRSRGPKRDGRWTRGAGGRGRTGGRRRTAQGPDCARIVT